MTTKREVTATKRFGGHSPAPSVTRQRMSRRRLPLDYLDSGDEYEKDASDSDEDADRSGVVSSSLCQCKPIWEALSRDFFFNFLVTFYLFLAMAPSS